MHAEVHVLTADEAAQVHERTLKVLSERGMRVDPDEGRRVLAAAGAQVDEATRMVRFPPALVEEAVHLAPRQFALGGRRDDFSFPLNAGRFTLLADGGATTVLDRKTGERRAPTREDWLEATRIIDHFDDVGLYWSLCEHPLADQGPQGLVAYMTDVFATFGKHVQESFGDPALAPWVLEVCDIVFGGREEVRRRHPLSFLITPTSPLIIEAGFTGTWLAMRGWDIPVAVMPMPLMGATAPGSRLGTLLAANCETIGTLCLVQAAAPGTPFIYAPVLATMDPRTGRYGAGAIEQGALSLAAIDMARFYGLPVEASGSSTDAFEPGAQAGYEKAALGLMVTLGWPDVLVGPGLLGGAIMLSLEQLVIDIEIFRRARQARSGVPVVAGLWLDDVLTRVGAGGSFIGEPSTRHNVRAGEWLLSDFGNRDSFEAWRAAGRPTVVDEARVQVEQILATHEPPGLDDGTARALKELERRAAES
ncbi:MAG TPA: trimethylamine methyltransferase family protein [Thermoleophilia bacterium]|nr:trimethylamine methyltransferase family protein [Thermoleophilia bacterium]